MATSVNSVSANTLASLLGNQTQSTSGTTQGASEETFLQLLVAQIKNQDPMSPTDSTQFVSQLAQFSELEQVIGIRTDVGALRNDAEQTATTPVTSPTTPATPATNQTQV